MKAFVRIAVCLLVGISLAGGLALAQGADVGKLDIQAIKSLQVRVEDRNYVSDAVVIISNGGDKAIRLRNFNFDVQFKGDSATVPFGKAPMKEAVDVPKAVDGKASTVTAKIVSVVGPTNDETVGRLIQLFNFVGNPECKLVLVLNGEGEVGIQLENRGWAYQTVKLELEFTPTIQREVLFK